MKRMTFLLAGLLLFVASRVEAKEYFYYNLDASKTYLDVCYSQVCIKLAEGVSYQGFSANHAGLDDSVEPREGYWGFEIFAIVPGYDHDALMAELYADPQVDFATPVLIVPPPYSDLWIEGTELLVGFKENLTPNQIESIIDDFGLVLLRTPSIAPSYLVGMTTEAMDDPLDICNTLFEAGYVLWATPNALVTPVTADDQCGQDYVVGGDVDGDGVTTLADAVYLLNFIFKDGPPPSPDISAGDLNGDHRINIGDVVCIVNLLY